MIRIKRSSRIKCLFNNKGQCRKLFHDWPLNAFFYLNCIISIGRYSSSLYQEREKPIQRIHPKEKDKLEEYEPLHPPVTKLPVWLISNSLLYIN